MDDSNIYELMASIRDVEIETLLVWNPDEAQSWSCVRCDGWTPEDPPPAKCPFCGWDGNDD